MKKDLIMQYNKPPLAFMGNKKNMLKHIKQVLQDMQGDGYINDETIFLDVFGGSGLISHNIKQWYPKNRVIWNDYDNYQKRLDNISDTEILRAKIYEVLGNDTKEKATQAQKQEILDFIKDFESKGHYVDYVSLSVYLLFCGNYADSFETLSKHGFYNRVAKEALNEAKDYLQGVERVRQDFKALLDSYSHIQNKLLILDPPYLQTQVGNYKDCFRLGQFFELIQRVSKPYIFFGSENSDIVESFEYLKAYHNELEGYTYNNAYLSMGGKDYILYPQGRSLFENRKIV